MSSCCRKKQREKKADGKEIDRCVNPKSQVHLLVVNDTYCSMCPVRSACPGESPNPDIIPIQPSNEPDHDYPLCEYRRYQGDQKFKCGVTGLDVTPEICGRCNEETRQRVAKLPDKLKGYANAIKKWVAAGRPTRTEEEQKHILEEHCYKCEMYDKQKDACMNCGCSLAQTGNPLTSKIAMKTEKCPLGRWE